MAKFKDTKVGKFIAQFAPKILDVVDDYFPPAKLLTALMNKEELPVPQRMEFEKLMQDYEKEMFKMEMEDRQNARSIYDKSKDISDNIARRVMNWNLIFLAVMVAVNIACIKFLDSTLLAIVSNVIGQVIQMLINERLTVINFFYGSSRGSKDKDSTIETLTTQ
jgi:hypothetical protein